MYNDGVGSLHTKDVADAGILSEAKNRDDGKDCKQYVFSHGE
jgi:hypothetical protein